MVSIIRTKCCHLGVIASSHETCVVYFDSSWTRQAAFSDSSDLLVMLEKNDMTHVYHIADEFCDDMEGFVIGKGAKSLPCIAVYSQGRMTYFSTNLDDLIGVESAIQSSKSAVSTVNNSPPSSSLPSLIHKASSSQPVRLFISGDRSSVGKSTCCLFLLASLVEAGVKPEDLAYIKPITQCEAEQPVVKYCNEKGIANRGIGPVVFYKGFTRAFLEGNTDSSEQLLASVVQSVEEIERGKKLVLIDGVGYPAVGSICGISNADSAKVLNASVVLIGKSGVGDAVDSFNLNARFFEFVGVRVLGGIFNKIALEGFYNVDACRTAVTSYFTQYRSHCRAYGFVPVMTMGHKDDEKGDSEGGVPADLLATFMSHVDVYGIIRDAMNVKMEDDSKQLSKVAIRVRKTPRATVMVSRPLEAVFNSLPNPVPATNKKRPAVIALPPKQPVKKRSRAEIEAEARSKGAVGG
mmetsp:Transcript_31409/g.58490  ORF Transcript_31409/g.58490 Transcript_31409/m.58490 type:complete len:464 (-) Transcript_31409:417-1808(-)